VTPALSIIVVTWRSREDVLRLLASIAEHVTVDHEVVVVDDGSGDGTPEAVRERFPDAIVVARPVNGGLVAGRNDGLKVASGESVLMLDADTLVRPGSVETLLAALHADPSVGLVGPRLVSPDGELQLSCRRWPPFWIPLMRRGPYRRFVSDDPPVHRRHLMKDFDHASRRPVVWVAGAAQMWRRELADRLGSYDRLVSSYGGEDLDWCLRVWAAGLRVVYVPDAEIVHVEQNVTRRRQFGRKAFRALRDWYYLQLKHRRLRRDPRLAEANA
jgi:N-acetylglucosaminyl-diphospho-decaprenol L-rhamnosyltransferase